MELNKIKSFFKKHIEKFVFGLISLSIMGPLLKPGFILTLDMIFTPKMHFSFPPVSGVYAEIPRDLVLHLLTTVIPADFLEKVILVILFYAIPAAFYKFLSVIDYKNKFAKALKILTSVIYIWNPFVYERFLAGHWLFLIGYAITPLFLLSLVRLSRSSKGKELTKYFLISTGIWTLTSFVSVHHFFLFGLIFLVYLLIDLISTKGKSFPKFVPTLAISLLLNSFWLAPTLFYRSNIQEITGRDLLTFASTPDDKLGVFWNLFTFYGFWAERILMILPKDVLPLWPMPFLLLLFPFIYLILIFIPKKLRNSKWFETKTTRADRLISIILILLGLSGLILSLGSLGVAKPIYDVFYDKIPLLKPFREPEKFLSLYLLSFCGLFYISFQVMIEKLAVEPYDYLTKTSQKKLKEMSIYGLIAAYFILTFILTPTLFWGANNQITTTNFPKSWYNLEEISNKDSKILVLPYQSYALFSFNSRRISNPTLLFFSAKVISKETLDELYTPRCEVQTSNLCLNKTQSDEYWYNNLKQENVQYILVNKNDEWEDYDFLKHSEFFTKVIEDPYSYILKLK